MLRRAGWMTAGVGKIFHVDEESEACAPPALERPDRTCECGLATASCESCASRDTSRRLADTILYANNSAPLLRAVCYEAEADASSRVCARGPHGGEQHAYCACRLRSGASWPDEHVATLAIRRLKRFEQMGAPAKPFLLVVGFLRPHVPAHAPLRSLAAADALAISHALPDASARGPSTLQRAQPSTLDGMERRMSRGRVARPLLSRGRGAVRRANGPRGHHWCEKDQGYYFTSCASGEKCSSAGCVAGSDDNERLCTY